MASPGDTRAQIAKFNDRIPTRRRSSTRRPQHRELELSVVIPCLNESSTIASCVRDALDTMTAHGIDGEVVVSDNGSDDGSVDIARYAGARVVSCPAKGYGAALQNGITHARGRYILMADADQSYDFTLLPGFISKVRTGAQFVMGSRLRGEIERGAMPWLHRYVGTPVLTFILNTLFGTQISDCNCGMRCFDREVFLKLGIVAPGMEFASEMVVKAAVNGVPITELPIDFRKDQRGRRPHLRSFRDGWRHLRLLLWHAPDHTMTLPGLVMLTLGMLLVLSQVSGPLTIAHRYLDIHYMILGVTLALVGLSGTTLGLVIGATAPAGRVRHLRALAAAHRWMSFDRAVSLAGLLALSGLAADGFVLGYWLYHDGGELSAFFTRLTLFGLVLIAMGVQLGLSALLLGTATVTAREQEPSGAKISIRLVAAGR
jgi:hypothetical protein